MVLVPDLKLLSMLHGGYMLIERADLLSSKVRLVTPICGLGSTSVALVRNSFVKSHRIEAFAVKLEIYVFGWRF